MTKLQFVELVQTAGNYPTKIAAEQAIKAFTEAVTDSLSNKESISLVGFGTFLTTDIPERSGKIPGTDKTYTKAAHTAPKFKAGKSLKDSVAG